MDKKNVYFVVSLPRTGTSSLSRMAKIIGLKQRHSPITSFTYLFNNNEYDFYSDTPIFVPSTIDMICANENIEPRFIYIDRDFSDVFKSWVNVNLFRNYQHMVEQYENNQENISNSMLYDYNAYNESFGDEILTEENYNKIFSNHKKTITKKISDYHKKLLMYSFDDGWKPFCDFIGVGIPDEDIPILNKNKMFEKI